MTVRPLHFSDIPKIREMFDKSGLEYQFPDLLTSKMEAVLVVVDDQDRPLMACAAERILQLYLWSADFAPAAKLHGIRLLHEAMAQELRRKGYNSVEAFIPPTMVKSFTRRLERMFQWTRNWPSWSKGF